MKGRRIQSAFTLQVDQLLVEFVRVNNIQDSTEYLSASEAWLKKYNAIKSKIPEDRKNEFVECENNIEQKRDNIFRSFVLDEMEVHAKGFKKQFDAYLSREGKESQEKTAHTPSLKEIKKNYEKFMKEEFYQDFKLIHPKLAEKFENWMNNRLQKERDEVLKSEMKGHLANFRDQMAYLHDPDNAKKPIRESAPKNLSEMQRQYDQFKESEFYQEYKERFPNMADRFEKLMAREIQKEKDSLAEFRKELHSKLDALNVDVATANEQSKLNPKALSQLNEFNQAINIHKDLEQLEDRMIFQAYSKGLDHIEATLEKPNKKAPNWGTQQTHSSEPRKAQRPPMMGVKANAAKGQSEISKQQEPGEVRPSRRSSTRGSTG